MNCNSSKIFEIVAFYIFVQKMFHDRRMVVGLLSHLPYPVLVTGMDGKVKSSNANKKLVQGKWIWSFECILDGFNFQKETDDT